MHYMADIPYARYSLPTDEPFSHGVVCFYYIPRWHQNWQAGSQASYGLALPFGTWGAQGGTCSHIVFYIHRCHYNRLAGYGLALPLGASAVPAARGRCLFY